VSSREFPCAGEPGRRAADDRRRKPTPPFSRYMFVGRRRAGRRDGEAANIYIDRYSPREWFLAVGVVVLSGLDLLFTLLHLDAGGREVNPVMAWFLNWGGIDAFAVAKTLFTLVGVCVLLLHARFHRVNTLFRLAFGLYGLLFFFHLYVMYARMA